MISSSTGIGYHNVHIVTLLGIEPYYDLKLTRMFVIKAIGIESVGKFIKLKSLTFLNYILCLLFFTTMKLQVTKDLACLLLLNFKPVRPAKQAT